jgi:carboxypeptidase family protein
MACFLSLRRLREADATETCGRAFLSLAALIFCLALSGTGASAGQRQTAIQPLTGIVADALHQPVRGVVVTLRSGDGRMIAVAITDNQGRFRLPESAAGTYALTTRRKAFKSATTHVVLPESARKYLELVLVSGSA